MADQKKSMDDVLASIRKIIKTDPNAVPPDASTLPPEVDPDDETAQSVLSRLRKESGKDDDEPPRALSGATDDPEETANAVLERLREEAEKEQKSSGKAGGSGRGKGSKDPEEPEMVPTPDEPPAVATDDEGVPDLEEEPLELGADTGARLLEPEEAAEPDPEPEAVLPAAAAPAPAPRDAGAEPPIMLDEAALEDTVRRIVRDELTGDMGRRMTKNVQRMIETEVKRLLSERGSD